MAQQVFIAGALFNDVPSISVPDSNSVYHPFVDPSVTTAAASDVAQGKQFIAADGTLTQGTASGGSATLITKSITANGTYNASSDNADGYSSVTVNVSGGGGGDSWSWIGKNPAKIQTWTEHKKFSETGFSTWTYTTSATTIRAAQDYTQLTLDNQHDFVQVFTYYVHFDYGNWLPVVAMMSIGSQTVYAAYRCPQDLSSFESEVPDNLASNSSTTTRTYYNNSSGAKNVGTTAYGLYLGSVSSPSITGGSSSTPKITFHCPAITARGNNTYFNNTAFSHVDMNASYIDITCEIWSVDVGTSYPGAIFANAVHALNSGV